MLQLYRNLDLVEFERQFSAYQRQDGDVYGTLSPGINGPGNLSSKAAAAAARVLTVIDGRRAQNCTILLSKLKMSNSELAQAVMSVDNKEEIPKDMCEQVGPLE